MISHTRSSTTLLLVALFAANAEAQQRPSRERIIAATDSLAKAAIEAGPIAGVAVAVARGPELILAKGYGLANVEHEVPITPRTVFRLASVTKQFTAAAILRLAQDGKLSVEDELTKYIPGYPTHGHHITIHHLLTHTSGIKDYTANYVAWRRLDMTHEQVVAKFSSEPMEFAPGSKWSYSNSGYYLLGMIIEKVSGQSYAEYLRSTLFEPLGMTQTSYCHNDPLIPHRAQGYAIKAGRLVNAEIMSMTSPGAAGGLCSTVGDMIVWTRALHGGKVIAPTFYQRMITPAKLNDGTATNYGYGLQIVMMDGHRSIEHEGGISGFGTSVGYYPDDSLIVVALNNTRYPTIRQNVARVALGLPLPVAP